MFGKKQQTREIAELKVVTVVGEGTVIDGNFTAKESTRIDGVVHGDVNCGGSLILGVHGAVHGNVKAKNVFSSGHIYGDVISENKIEATETSKIIGNIDTSVLVVDENAVVHGKCNMHVILPKSEEGAVKKTGKRGRPRKVQVTLPLDDVADTSEELTDQIEETEVSTTETPAVESTSETGEMGDAVKEQTEEV